MRLIDPVRRALLGRQPTLLDTDRRAAVAIVLHPGAEGDEVLFIERARRLGDPWSGHMAFPGGRVSATDPSAQDAAARETREEVGFDPAAREFLGRLDDLAAGIPVIAPFALSSFVYACAEKPVLAPNHEVETALWVPAAALVDPARHTGYWWGLVKMPGICVGDPERHVVWGLTYRLLESLFSALGTPLAGGGWLGGLWS